VSTCGTPLTGSSPTQTLHSTVRARRPGARTTGVLQKPPA